MLMTPQEWLASTNGGAFSVRSSELKAVDAAIRTYHDSLRFKNEQVDERNLKAIRRALELWMGTKGANWKASERNTQGGVERLLRQLDLLGTGASFGASEREALDALRREADRVLTTLLAGQRVQWRSGRSLAADNKFGLMARAYGLPSNSLQLGTGHSLFHHAREGRPYVNAQVAAGLAGAGGAIGLGGGGGSAVSPEVAMRAARELVGKLVQDLSLRHEVFHALLVQLPQFMGELAAAMTPFLGVASSGVTAMWNTFTVSRAQYRLDSSRDHARHSLATGNPEEALRGLLHMLELERDIEAASAAISWGEVGGKLAGVLADGGTATTAAVGLAANLLKLANIIKQIAREAKEKRAANHFLASGRPIDADILIASPLVSCYVILAVPTSVMVNAIFRDRFGQPGWMTAVERVVHEHNAPLKEHAFRIVHAKRIWIPGLQQHAGVLKPNEHRLKAMQENFAKKRSAMEGFGSDNLPASLRR